MVVVAAFAGIGGLRRSLDRLGVHVLVHLSIEMDPPLRRVTLLWWPDLMECPNVLELSTEALERLVALAVEMGATCVIVGGGFPCQDVSLLNASRGGSEAERTGLYGHRGWSASSLLLPNGTGLTSFSTRPTPTPPSTAWVECRRTAS